MLTALGPAPILGPTVAERLPCPTVAILDETTVNRSLRSRRQVGWFVLAIAAFGAGDAADDAHPAQAEHGRESFVNEFKPLFLGKILLASYRCTRPRVNQSVTPRVSLIFFRRARPTSRNYRAC